MVLSDAPTFAATASPTLFLSDVFSFAVAAGGNYSFGLIAQDPNTSYGVSDMFPLQIVTQNGITPFAGNENWTNFDSPQIAAGGSVTISMQLRGVAGAVVATPEPASVALMATGLVAVFAGAKRRRQRAA